MKKTTFIRILSGLLLSMFLLINLSYGQVTTNPTPPNADGSVTITFDATQGSAGLLGYTGDVYAHTGVITNLSTGTSDWKYVIGTWGTNTTQPLLTRTGTNTYTLTIPNIRTFYNVPASESILKMAFVFRSSNGSLTGKATGGADIFVTVGGLSVNITSDITSNPIKSMGDQFVVTVAASGATSIILYDNDNVISTSTSATITASSYGKHVVKAVVSDGTKTMETSTYYYVRQAVTTQALPANMVAGVNYGADNTSVTLVLYDPADLKQFAFVLGDFNNWEFSDNSYMKRTSDDKHYWITLTGLTAGQEYQYQYYVYGSNGSTNVSLRLADPYCEKVIDPDNDKYISSTTYPNLIPYPFGKTTGITSVFQTGQTPYQWKVPNFQAPPQENMIIYELLVRDFVDTRYLKSVMDSIPYLKALGINAIELMPFNEFEGNDSWGYNSSFHFATDKAYGTKNDYKKFIDLCHENGIAVIMDMVLNHQFGQSPMVQMYFDKGTNKPTKENPWFNVTDQHPYSVGYDFNHGRTVTKDFCKRVMKYWLTEFKVDGYRFDLSKGFVGESFSTTDVGSWNAYNQDRINLWNEYNTYMKSVKTNPVVILEHLGEDPEENALASNGMMPWGKMNGEYSETGLGNGMANLSRVSYKTRGMAQPRSVGYMESHDEERMMYKALQYGVGDIKTLPIALKRMELNALFFLTVPGPKMIWQFGEIGYDESLHRCPNGTVSTTGGCNTDAKPRHAEYFKDQNRKKLYNVYRAILNLRKEKPTYFNTSDFNIDFAGTVKKLFLYSTDGAKPIVVIGNFGTSATTVTVDFTRAGTWYEIFSQTNITLNGSTSTSINLAAGEYKLYTDVKFDLPNSLQTPFLTPSATTLNIAQPANSQASFDIASNVKWTIKSTETWLTTSTGAGYDNGTVTLVAEANQTGAPRTATITIAGVDVGTKTVTVTQAGSSVIFTVSPLTLNVNAAANSTGTFSITSNQSWTIASSQTWLTVSNLSGSNNSTITVTAAENTSTSTRTANVTVTSGNLSQVVVVTQAAAAPVLTVSTSTLNVNSAANSTATFNITSNTSWTLASSQNWLTANVTSGSNNTTITVTAAENTALTTRSATVTVTAGALTQTVTITQAAVVPVLTVSTNTLSVNAAANSVASFNITSNQSWTIVSSQPWLTTSAGTNSGNATVYCVAAENTSTSTRSATVTVTAGNLSQVVTITQAAAVAVLTVSTTSLNVNAAANSTNTFNITSNTSWTLASSQNWLTANVTSGSNNAAITLTAAQNTGTTRTATVTVTAGNLSQVVNVTQADGSTILTVSASTLSINATAGSTATFNITSNVSWTITSSESWLTANTGTGSNNAAITLTAAANPTVSTRTATITVAAGAATQTVTVTQVAGAATLTVSTPTLSVNAAASSNGTFNITSNTSWTVVSSENWLTVSNANGSNNASITVTATENTTVSTRSATVTVTASALTQTITVTQAAGAATLTVSTSTLSVNAAANSTATFNITSNTNWTASSSENWLTVSSANGSGNTTITVTATENATVNTRSATVTVTAGALTQTVTITQVAGATVLTVSISTLSVNATASSTGTFNITSNASWTVASSEGWLTVSSASGSGNATITVTATANTLISQRSANVTVTAGTTSKTVTITQAGTNATLDVSSATLSINAQANSTTTFNVTSNTNWTVTSSQTWLTSDKSTGSNNITVTLTATENTAATTRSAVISVAAGTLTKLITVTQAAGTTGFAVVENASVKIYPNPTQTEMFIENIDKNARISIFNLNGKLILDQKAENKQINISSLAKGVYMIKITTDNQVVTKKFVKE